MQQGHDQDEPTQYRNRSQRSSAPIERDFGIFDLVPIFRSHQAFIVGLAVVAGAIATILGLIQQPVYRAQVLLAPVMEEQSNDLSAIADQFGGLALRAGVDLQKGRADTEESIATLRSKSFTDAFIRDENLMPVLFSDLWNENEGEWAVDEDDIPTDWDAFELFDEDIRTVTTNKKTGLITLTIEWFEPELSAIWANKMVERLNQRRQSIAIQEAEKSIAYLNEQLAKTSVVELQQAIYRLIESQTKKIMIAHVRDDFAFKVIDPASAPDKDKSVKPKPMVMGISGFFIGLLLALLIATLRTSYRLSGSH